jgi:dolichol-phosphate mannosyltransferase
LQIQEKEAYKNLGSTSEDCSRFNSTLVLIAALNEEEGIGLTITEVQKHLIGPRILVVDGNSDDRTVDVSKDLGADVLFQDGKGKGDALSKGLEYTDEDVDYLVITDADFTYPAEYLPEMIDVLAKNPNVGMVCGNRFNGNVDDNALRSRFYLGNKLLCFAHKVLNGVSMKDPLTGLRVVRAALLRGFVFKSKSFDVEVELNHLIEQKGYQIVEVPIQYRKRVGEKKLKMKHGATILKRILLQAFS